MEQEKKEIIERLVSTLATALVNTLSDNGYTFHIYEGKKRCRVNCRGPLSSRCIKIPPHAPRVEIGEEVELNVGELMFEMGVAISSQEFSERNPYECKSCGKMSVAEDYVTKASICLTKA